MKLARLARERRPGRLWHGMRTAVRMLVVAAQAWIADGGPRWGAALAFYTLFSLAPILMIAVACAGLFFRGDAAENQVLAEVASLMGPQTRETLRIMLDGARDRVGDAWAAVLGAGTLVVGATAVFLELQDALNRIWRAHHARGNGVLAFVKARVISFALVLAIVFLLLVSLLVSAGLSALSHYAWTQMGGAAALLKAADMLLSFAVITVLFAALFKYLPDTPVPWRDVWEGALFTAGLFTVGKHAIGLYLGTSGVSSSYGAAGSLVLVMMWVYYSTQILLFGAEFTHVVAATRRMSGEKKEKRNGKV